MKKLSVVVAGTGQIRDVEIQPGTTAGVTLVITEIDARRLATPSARCPGHPGCFGRRPERLHNTASFFNVEERGAS